MVFQVVPKRESYEILLPIHSLTTNFVVLYRLAQSFGIWILASILRQSLLSSFFFFPPPFPPPVFARGVDDGDDAVFPELEGEQK